MISPETGTENLGDGFHRLNRTQRFACFDPGASFREFDINNISKLSLCVIGDTDGA